MGVVKTKYNVLNKSLDSLHESPSYFDKVLKTERKEDLLDTYEVVYKISRDSIIQRFEFSVELFWKYLRIYLEEVKKVKIDSNSPRHAKLVL